MHRAEPRKKRFSLDVGVEVELVQDGEKRYDIVIVDELMEWVYDCSLRVLWLRCWWY